MADTADRVYFTLLDEGGRAFPAVAYWAGVMGHDAPGLSPIRTQQFVKLIGTGELLREVDPGVFESLRTRVAYTRLPIGR